MLHLFIYVYLFLENLINIPEVVDNEIKQNHMNMNTNTNGTQPTASTDATNTADSQSLPSLSAVKRLLQAMFDVETKLDQIPLTKQADVFGQTSSLCCVLPGNWLVQMLEATGLTCQMVCMYEFIIVRNI